MQNTNIITTEQAPNTISASNAVFNVQALGQLTAFADLMAQSAVTVPKHLAGKPADCMAIVMQAMQWGMNPYAVAQKTHLVNGVLGYEAQLVNAVISSSSAIQGRFHYEYGGAGKRSPVKKMVVMSWAFISVSARSCAVKLRSPGVNQSTWPTLPPETHHCGRRPLNSRSLISQ